MKEKLILLIKSSEGLNKKLKQEFLDIVDFLDDEQILQVIDFLEKTQDEVANIKANYQKNISKIYTKYLEKIKTEFVVIKKEGLIREEKQSNEPDSNTQESLLSQLNNL